MTRCLLICLCAFTQVDSVTDSQLCPYLLVSARVQKVEDRGATYEAQFQIERVFAEAEKSSPAGFSISLNRSGQSVLGSPAFSPSLQPGDTVIWLLERSESNGLQHVPAGMRLPVGPPLGIVSLPARRGDPQSRYPEVLAWAESVRLVASLEETERWPALKAYAKSGTPEISKWALSVIASADEQRARQYFRELMADLAVPIAQKSWADGLLVQMDGKGWSGSEERFELLQSWIEEEELSQQDVSAVLSALDLAAQHRDFDDGAFFELLGRASNRRNFFEFSPSATISIASRYAVHKETSHAFEFLVRQIEHSTQPTTRVSAARALKQFVASGNSERLMVITALAGRTNDAEVREILTGIANSVR